VKKCRKAALLGIPHPTFAAMQVDGMRIVNLKTITGGESPAYFA
jgi:hypothetical protein